MPLLPFDPFPQQTQKPHIERNAAIIGTVLRSLNHSVEDHLLHTLVGLLHKQSI